MWDGSVTALILRRVGRKRALCWCIGSHVVHCRCWCWCWCWCWCLPVCAPSPSFETCPLLQLLGRPVPPPSPPPPATLPLCIPSIPIPICASIACLTHPGRPAIPTRRLTESQLPCTPAFFQTCVCCKLPAPPPTAHEPNRRSGYRIPRRRILAHPPRTHARPASACLPAYIPPTSYLPTSTYLS